MGKFKKSIGLIFTILCLSLLCSCSDKDGDDVIYYPYGTIGVNGVIYSIEDDYASVIGKSKNSQQDDFVIVSEIKKDGKVYPVTVIRNSSFSASKISKLTIPSSITEMGAYAFTGTDVEELYYTGDLKSWCHIIFYGRYIYNGGHTGGGYYESYANPLRKDTKFYVDGEPVKDVLFIEDIEDIKPYTFQNLNIEHFIAGDGVKNIYRYAFDGSSVKKMTLRKDVEFIGEQTLDNLEEIEIPERFTGRLKVAKVVITKGGPIISTIKEGPTRIKVPDLETWLDIEGRGYLVGAVKENTGTLTYPNYVLLYVTGPEFDLVVDGKVLKDMVIPGRYKEIEEFGLAHCSITSVVFEEGVEDLQACVMAGCRSLTSVKLPSTFKRMSYDAIPTGIKSLELDCKEPPEIYYDYPVYDYERDLKERFETIGEGCELVVPQESVELYKTTYPWSEFKNIRGK